MKKTRFQKKIRHIVIASRAGGAKTRKKAAEIEKFLKEKAVSSENVFLPAPGESAAAHDSRALSGRQPADLILSLGGDGSYLKAARLGGQIPILGINMGSLGFLTPCEAEKTLSVLDRALKGRMFAKKNYFLETGICPLGGREGESHQSALSLWDQTLKGQKKTFYSINEAAIERGPLSRLISFSVYINRQYIYSSKSDGLIAAGPVGSTAYNLAAGGPILHSEARSMVITPIASHSLTVRPIVIHDKSEILLQAHGRAFFVSDGEQREALSPSDTLLIKKSKRFFVSLTEKEEAEFPLLREKLKFGQRD